MKREYEPGDGWNMLGLLVVLILTITACAYFMNPLPQVYMTYPNHECVKVVPADAGSCNDLPDRYNMVWVSPKASDFEK